MEENVMDKKFFCQWFKGFAEGLDEMDSDSRSRLLKHCAKCCADTGVLQAHLKLRQAVDGNRDEFYRRLGELGNVRGEIAVPGKEYFISFPDCACDVHTAGGVDSPSLCECSRQSILYVAERVWEGSKIQVEQIETALSGGTECRFKIVFVEN